jgi:hydroxymethylpyrimidine/phosphomethylpyrimidine kinase
MGVSGVYALPSEIVIQQIRAVMDDMEPLAIKIGMIPNAELATALVAVLRDHPYIPVILDPVMAASSGSQLMEDKAIAILKNELFPKVTLVTPNLDEARLITGIDINTADDMEVAAACFIKSGCNAVLIKGGHLKGDTLCDVYLDKNGVTRRFESRFINSNNTHGTGCTLSSAIAAFLALGDDMLIAIERSKTYVHLAIEYGKDIKTGEGHGPLNHFFDPQKLIKYKPG